MTPATLSRRCAAWSLDALPVALVAVALCRQRLLDGLDRFHAALATLCEAMARGMLDAVRDGTPLPAFVRQAMADPALRESATGLASIIGAVSWPLLLAFAGVGLFYNVAFEVSTWQATPGKRALGLRVVDAAGRRIGAARAAARHVAGALSWLSLNLGHALAALPPQRRALHDVVSGTRVAQRDDAGALPGWAKAWLAFNATVALLATAWLLQTTNAALEAAFDALLR